MAAHGRRSRDHLALGPGDGRGRTGDQCCRAGGPVLLHRLHHDKRSGDFPAHGLVHLHDDVEPGLRDGAIYSSFAERLADMHATPWWWLAAHGLTNAETDFNEAELLDTDEDGHPAWAEYVADTDPGNTGSVLKAIAGYNTIRWPGSTNRYYHVYGVTDLSLAFERVASNLPGVSPVNVYTDTVFQGANPAFYRVRALLAPDE